MHLLLQKGREYKKSGIWESTNSEHVFWGVIHGYSATILAKLNFDPCPNFDPYIKCLLTLF